MYQQIKLAARGSRPTTEAVALFLFGKSKRLPASYDSLDRASGSAIRKAIQRAEFDAVQGSVTTLYPDHNRPERLLIAGLGDSSSFGPSAVRAAAAALARTAFTAKLRRLRIQAAAALQSKITPDLLGRAIGDGLVIAGFQFNQFKGSASQIAHKSKPATLTLEVEDSVRTSLKNAMVVGRGITTARCLAATPPNIANPSYIASFCRKLARQTSLSCTVIDQAKARKLRMGGLLAVGSGGSAPPNLICLEHKPSTRRVPPPTNEGPVLLVGKAITFDTGGYSLKIGGSMGGMKYDKSGGMTVIGAMESISRLNLNRHVIGLIPCAENMIDQRAYRVDDIITFCNGVTCEISNTDAEGRLVLADALAYGTRCYRPSAVIDLATLTGGVVVALGTRCAGMFCNNAKLRRKIESAAQETGERVWWLPLWPEHRAQMRSTHADLINSADRKASPIQGAAFLSHFVGAQAPQAMPSIPWAHLDIAGVADIDRETPGSLYPKGPTGFGVRLLTCLIEQGL